MKSEQTMTELKEAIIAVATDGVKGAVYGGITGMVFIAARCNPRTLRPLFQFGGMCARGFSVSFAGWTATEHILKGIRGPKDDLTADMVAASGGGLAYSFVSQGFRVKPAHALSWAACYAVGAGTVSKAMETIRARSELSTRGKASAT